jgi:predicted HTH transcriptional regulator
MTPEEFNHLVHSLVALPRETEWVEFKVNKADPQEIGENVSAVSNGAALHRQPMGYVVWGIEDEHHAVVGTTFQPRSAKKGNEELENWLSHSLEPAIDVRIHEGQVDDRPVVVFEIPPATHMPVRFFGREYLRVGSYTKPLTNHPEKERALWALFSELPFEIGIAAGGVSSDDVLALVDYPEYFRLADQPLPDNRGAILAKLVAEKIINPRPGDRYDITNVGAILFARNLRGFDRLARKALRVIIYKGDNRVETLREQPGSKGYAIGFEGAVGYINDQLPQNEEVKQALRSEVRMYPEIAIRELVANALIHQDFNVTGAGPMVEIFTNRMEISNPGVPLIDTLRFIDEPPRSRNEALAKLMRRMNICEERGSGIDKVIFAVEAFQLPAPDFRVAGASTVAVLLGPRGFADMDRAERLRACYQHACLQYVSGKRMTNASLRERLGIKESNYPQASRIIRDAIDGGLVRPHGEGSANYVPFWA